ncbi:antibiotic biosynthesis monooxygenase [Campylobacter sp. MIT 99-7217]|uniref:putative quinol monooxygenase n=1 Tax=Campylobacter sp. MIT 99-7217 TaxID=535091 RepID=UPI001159D6FD|nr:antibiotic biosynthesis monooxygenase [Campylobacter sp. MIT 99-7217]TQR31888.1 antibiotic biosynthesis monooxygenase [Campylobacter sp. MIT 99-7217]
MKKLIEILGILVCVMGVNLNAKEEIMLTKISKITIKCEFLDEYRDILLRTSSKAVQTEPGVLILYAMQDSKNPCEFNIIEAYKDEQSYKSHLQTPHFKEYKQSTLHMVEKLEFIPYVPLNPKMFLSKEF